MIAELEERVIDQISEKNWYAIRTGFRKEKAVSVLLSKKEIEYFLPLQSKVKKYDRKIKKYDIPLISCYLFVYINPKNYVKVLETEYVFQFIKFNNQLAIINQEEIDFMKRLVSSDFEMIVEEGLKPVIGDTVEILSGNLAGTQGTLVEYKGKEKVVILLKSVGYSLYLQVDTKMLKKVSTLLKPISI